MTATQRLDFHTKTAFVLTVVSLVGLGILSILYAEEEVPFTGRILEEEDDYSNYSCNKLYEITPSAGEDQCEFAKTCNDNAGVWAAWVFCSKRISVRTGCTILSPIMLLWLLLLFRMLGSTAEDFFSPSLEMFSNSLGLPPRFAGVSLLALGNGAADVSATISAITNDVKTGYKLSLGALSGAAMLISGVISAVVIVTADGVPCRGALVRDVAALIITVLIVYLQLASGTIGPDDVTIFLTIYVIFVLLVLMADVYHRAVVIPRQTAVALELEEQRQLEAADEIVQVAQPRNLIANMITSLSNYDNQQFENENGIESEDLASDRPIQLHGHGGILDRHTQAPATPASLPAPQGSAYSILEDSIDHSCVRPGSRGVPADGFGDAAMEFKNELITHFTEAWEEVAYDGDLHKVTKFLLICELPFTVLRKITVAIPCENYYCRSLVTLSMFLSPIWLSYYLYSAGFHVTWMPVVIFTGVMVISGMLVQRLAPGGSGDMALMFAVPIALYGFVVAATWIDTIANALVSLLNFLGIILHIPGAILGLTILAWGNSMGDLSANMTMARKGLANMAMTACFAGPVFNILVGLGMGFSSLASKTGEPVTSVELSPSITIGFLFIAINGVLLLATGLRKGKIPKRFGYGALGLYTAYLIASISLQYSKYGDHE